MGGELGRRTSPDRRWVLVVATPILLVLLFSVTVVTGIPGLRPSLRSLQATAAKIDECDPDAAQVDWVVGRIDTIGEPIGPGKELTPDERAMIRTNGKVGIVCGAIR